MSDFQKQILDGPGLCVVARDKNYRYIYCNENTAKAANLDSPQQMLGKTDSSFFWRDQAELYQIEDRKVMGGQIINLLRTVPTPFKKIILLVSKNQLTDKQGKCIGSISTCIDVSEFSLKKALKNCYFEGNKLYLGECFTNEYLTKREVDILRNILLGLTAKQIAQNYRLSIRTIETHIDKVKKKLQCQTKGDLIATAMKTGLTYLLLDDDFVREN